MSSFTQSFNNMHVCSTVQARGLASGEMVVAEGTEEPGPHQADRPVGEKV